MTAATVTTSSTSPPSRTFPRLGQRAREASRRQYESLVRQVCRLVEDGNDGPTIVGVTSSASSEGVSTIARNLAVCGADVLTGSTLLVDAHLERPSNAKAFAVSETPGLDQILHAGETWENCVQRGGNSGLAVLPAGTTKRSPSRIRRMPAAERFLTSLRDHFDFIVVDLPPVGDGDTVASLSGSLDGVLLVVEAERLRVQVLMRAKEQLIRSQVNLLGVVLNKRRMHIPGWLYHRI